MQVALLIVIYLVNATLGVAPSSQPSTTDQGTSRQSNSPVSSSGDAQSVPVPSPRLSMEGGVGTKTGQTPPPSGGIILPPATEPTSNLPGNSRQSEIAPSVNGGNAAIPNENMIGNNNNIENNNNMNVPLGSTLPPGLNMDLDKCNNCQEGSFNEIIRGGQAENIFINRNDGRPVGQIDIPSDFASAINGFILSVQYIEGDRLPVTLGAIGQVIMNINLYDANGMEINSLSSPLTICITNENDIVIFSCFHFILCCVTHFFYYTRT